MSDGTTVTVTDAQHVLRAIDIAADARRAGNHPFGAVFVSSSGEVAEAQNTVVTGQDPTGHAELNLVRILGGTFTERARHAGTLYSSTEPCAMCAAAIHWAGIGRVVYGLPATALNAMVADGDAHSLDLPCREVFERGGGLVTVAGPCEQERAAAVHAGFWDAPGDVAGPAR